MKLKFLLLFLLVVGCGVLGNAQTKPYNHLIITEAFISEGLVNYVEFTNMGTETIDLSEFEFGTISPWDVPWTPAGPAYFTMLPKKMLAPGKSFVISNGVIVEPRNWLKDPLHNCERITKPEMFKLADLMCYLPELNTTASDTVTPWYHAMQLDNGRDCWYLRHHYINTDGQKDSMIIDQFGGIFDEEDGTSADMAHDVAGVVNATDQDILIRKNSVTTGITEFSSNEANADAAKLEFDRSRGLDFADSEWIPVPIPSDEWPELFWRAVFWTVGNQVDAKLDANTLISKTGKVKVDIANSTITEPWGIRRDDSIMYQFDRKPGLAWEYTWSETREDSAYCSARTGDKLKLYACGNEATVKTFNIVVEPPTASDNIVIPKTALYNDLYMTDWHGPNPTYKLKYLRIRAWHDIRVSDGVIGMDTISRIPFASRIDTLYKYLEKAPNASWKIIPQDGIIKPDLKNGDILQVTSENGILKEYFLKLANFQPEANATLTSITWPDIPSSFKGDIAGSFGWKGDTIPGFKQTIYNYVVQVPLEYKGIPALMFTKQRPSSNVVVTRVKSLDGNVADRTVTFTITAEDNITVNVYKVLFNKEKDPEFIQPFIGEPFFSQYVYQESWSNCYLEIANPGTAPLDLSNYMICGGFGAPSDVFSLGTGVDDWGIAYDRYVPGKKWQDEANWQVQPCILEPDLATNPIVYPGGVFVIADVVATPYNYTGYGDGDSEYRAFFNVDFAKNPWGITVPSRNAINFSSGGTLYMYKILNDSVKTGLKAATDPNDFKLIETFGTGGDMTSVTVGGIQEIDIQSNNRKPNVYKPNPVVMGSNGTTPEDSEWNVVTTNDLASAGANWPEMAFRICDGLGSHVMDDVTINKSTVTSLVYKVSPGYSEKETILGLITGTTVTGFYNNILKANELQTLKVKSAANGAELAEAAEISKGDTLIVLSADSTNTSKYILDVSANGLSSDALLTSTKYIIEVTGTTGTISGTNFTMGTLLKTVLDGVIVPPGASLTITDENDAYMSLTKLNYDTAYVNVIATDKIYFEVIAENHTSKVLYQLMPASNPSDAYVTSDLYSVDQSALLIQFVLEGTSVTSLMNNISPAPGATVALFDKGGFVREFGAIYKDDKLVVTSSDGNTVKTYYLSMLNKNAPTYLAYVISDVYVIDQLANTILGPKSSTTLADFYANLDPSFGATLSVLDKDGNVSALADLSVGDQLLVTAADGNTTALYQIDVNNTKVVDPLAQNIKMYPNPTSGRVIVQGLTKGNRVQVFNSVGIMLRDVIVDNSTEYVSLTAQPAGIYIFVISSGDKNINIQKIAKK